MGRGGGSVIYGSWLEIKLSFSSHSHNVQGRGHHGEYDYELNSSGNFLIVYKVIKKYKPLLLEAWQMD